MFELTPEEQNSGMYLAVQINSSKNIFLSRLASPRPLARHVGKEPMKIDFTINENSIRDTGDTVPSSLNVTVLEVQYPQLAVDDSQPPSVQLSRSQLRAQTRNAEANAKLLLALEQREQRGEQPKLEINKFDGDKSYYNIFKQMFESTFGYASESVKYKHLRNLVKGEAACHINFIDPGPGGYGAMWLALDKEYLPKHSVGTECLDMVYIFTHR